jgi:hypothetical protein
MTLFQRPCAVIVRPRALGTDPMSVRSRCARNGVLAGPTDAARTVGLNDWLNTCAQGVIVRAGYRLLLCLAGP